MDNCLLPFRNHTALLLATALPYLQPGCRHPVELILKFLEFSETMKLYREFHAVGQNPLASFFPEGKPTGEEGIFGLVNTLILDVEGLLGGLSKVCTGSEKDLVNLFLNLLRAKNFYDTYGDLLKTMMPQGDGTGFPFGDLSGIMQSFSNVQSPPVPDSCVPEASSDNISMDTAFGSFGADLSSLLTPDQQDTLTLLKSLFADET